MTLTNRQLAVAGVIAVMMLSGAAVLAPGEPRSAARVDRAVPVVHISRDGSQEWRFRGRRHRDHAPAVVASDGTREWWFHGTLLMHEGPDGVWYTAARQ